MVSASDGPARAARSAVKICPTGTIRPTGTSFRISAYVRKGIFVRKAYQNKEIGTNQPGMPNTVSVELAEMAGDRREGRWLWWSGPGGRGDGRDPRGGRHRDV